MKIAFILPTKYTEKFYSSDYHLIISDTVLKNPKHAEIYKKMGEKGDYVIVDNGLFELGYPLPTADILKAVEMTNASEVVAPDHLENSELTIEATEKFLKELGDSKISVMGVPQGRNMESWLECYKYMIENPRINRIGLSCLSLNLIYRDCVPPTLWRSCMLDYLATRDLLKKRVHLLGVTDNPKEIKLVRSLYDKYIDGIDSSSAWVHGLHGHKFDPEKGLLIPKIKEKINFEFDEELTEQAIEAIQHNITTMKNWAN